MTETKMILPPRIRGKVSEAEPGQGYDGKFFFHIEMATLYGKRIGEPFGPIGPFDTEAIAKQELRRAARLACEACEKSMSGGKPLSGVYLDLKNSGIMRQWDEN